MGNSLCRERIARADNSKNPIDRIIGRCAQICPANEVKSNYWQKHVLETGPPTRTQPQSTFNDGWRKVTLTVPNGKTTNEGDLGETPIAPPRRKRSSVIDRQPCGFKELFGNNVSRRSSCDSILNTETPLSEREQEMLQQKRKSKSISDFNDVKAINSLPISTIRIPVTRTLSLMERAMVQQTTIPAPRPTLQRKISRVGNKKSDKFFGENLSDCLSDDPITPEPEPTSISFTYQTISTLITPIPHSGIETNDKLDEFVMANVTASNQIELVPKGTTSIQAKEILDSIPKPFIVNERIDTKPLYSNDRKNSLDKKAEFLMAMLEGTTTAPTAAAATQPPPPHEHQPGDETKIMTPPRRSHLKKRQTQTVEPDVGIHVVVTTAVATNANEPIVVTSDVVDATKTPENSVEKRTIVTNSKQVGKTVELVNDATNDNEDEMYKGMTPVEEPIIVPRKRPTKHICDGDDHHQHIKKHMEPNHGKNATNHTENKENQPTIEPQSAAEVEKYIIQQVNQSPEKPKRECANANQIIGDDATKSTPSTPLKCGDCLDKPVPRVRHLSQENLMYPKSKMNIKKSNDTIDLMRIKSQQQKCSSHSNNTTNGKSNGRDDALESVLKKYTSQQSFFTQDLLNQIADRVYGFQDPYDMPESCDDGSVKCTPNSKLTTRKISVHRKESSCARPILENDCECAAIYSTPKIIQMEHKEPKSPQSRSDGINNHNDDDDDAIIKPTIIEQITTEAINMSIKSNIQPMTAETTKCITDQFILVEREHSLVCDTNETTQMNGMAALNLAEPNKLANTLNHILDDIYKVNSTILDEFQQNFCNSNSAIAHTKLENGISSDDENTDSDITVKTALNSEPNRGCVSQSHDVPHATNGEKRGSIVEVNAWFPKHNDLTNLSRRGSESHVGYNTRKVFPFGQSDDGAGAAFFDTKTLSKSAEHILNDKLSTASQQNEHSNDTPSKTDHSILLKYLKQ